MEEFNVCITVSLLISHTHKVKMKQFLPVLLCVLLVYSVTVEGEGSYCTVSTGYHQPSLYLRVCCVNSNLGQTVRMRENNHKKIIICPSVRPQPCPTSKLNLTTFSMEII